MAIEISEQPDLIPPFQPVRAIDFNIGDNYVLDVTANSQYAIASASDRLIRLYDLQTLNLAHTLQKHTSGISKIKVYQDQYLFSSSLDGSLVRWDVRAGPKPVQTFQYNKALSAFGVNCNDTMVAVGTNTQSEHESPDLVFYDTRRTDCPPVSVFTDSHADDITEIHWHPANASQLISSSADGLVNFYDVADFDEQEALVSVMNAGSAVSQAGFFGPSAEYVYCLTYTQTFVLLTLEGDLICDYGDVRNFNSDAIGFPIDCSYDPFTQRVFLLTGNGEGDVHIFHVNIGQLQHCQTLKAPGGHTDVVRSVYWNHQTQSILTGGEDGRMCAWQGVA